MNTNYSISGKVYVNDKLVNASYRMLNLSNSYITEYKDTDKFYYNINLLDYKTIQNNNDITAIEFKARVNGIDYYNRLFHILDFNKEIITMDSILDSNWNYSSSIKLDKLSNVKYRVNFITDEYQYIHYRMFYKYKDSYKYIDEVMLDKQIVDITFNYNGSYKLVGYILKDGMLLTYCSKEFVITSVRNGNGRYIEWE